MTDRSLRAETAVERAEIGSRVRRVFLKVLQTFFGQPSMDAFGYRWIENDPKTQIVIAAEFTQEQEIKDPNHQILVNRGPIQFQKISIDNTLQRNAGSIARKPNPARDDNEQPVGLAHKFVSMAFTEMQIQCYSELPAEAEKLATIAMIPFLTFQRQIRKAANLHRIDNPQLGVETPIQSSDSKIFMSVVPITVPVAFAVKWTTIVDPTFLNLAFELEVEDC